MTCDILSHTQTTPVLLGGFCHKCLAAAQLTVHKQSKWLHWPLYHLKNANKKSHTRN